MCSASMRFLVAAVVLGAARPWVAVAAGGAGGGGSGSGGSSIGGVGGGPPGALSSLGSFGAGPFDALEGTRLKSRLVEEQAVRRAAAAAKEAKEAKETKKEYCGVTDPTVTPLERHFLSRSDAVCNDNSPAGFYFRRSKKSRRWIMFLEGGWYCFDRASCEHRWRRLRPLMTSQGWPETRQVGGILSPDPEENPHWWTANHVFVPYCSSDSWAGTRRADDASGDFSFMGSVIVEKVVDSLLALNFTHGHKLILAGSSAGGVGALVNVDRVAAQLERQGVRAEVRAVADSGWFLDNEPFAPLECVDAHSCPPVEAIRRGQELWRGRIPDACGEQYPRHPWYCYFGYRLYETMKSPLFIFQWVFDEAQMTADNVGKPISKEQWDYIHSIGERLRKTFENVTALFAPSCISHTVLTKRDWSSVKIGEVSLPQALYCWDITPAAALQAKSSSGRHHVRVQSEEHHHDPGHHFSHAHHHAPQLGERERDGRRKNIRRRTNSERDREDGRRRRGRGKKSRRKTQEESAPDEDLLNARTGEERDNGERTGSGSRKKSHRKTSRRQSQGAGRPDVLNREMLADSPRDNAKVQDKAAAAPPYLVESNAIDTTQESAKLKQQQEEAEKREEGKKDLSRKEKRRRRQRRKNRKRGKKKRKGSKKRGKKRHRRQRNKDKTRKKKRKSKAPSQASSEDLHEEMCPASTLHLTDRCAWPHCNYACPKLLNPFTGEEMNFIELLKSFGLDMASVANALGIDIHTLNSMGNDELLLILTQ
ncbi:palmitoleoyl-protein carboxylesterase notum1'-like isoform X2 [Penaeus japonicus]|uniref:palmitoleoyl-protein carboxylesterase notum1'-like isoform X2 n=1 Tax=Penaeus japonicus TaxID=27405 RepID=UPI001C7122B1|nr:palmitoleoyl-protein carboxylesterase notum1'-like isoform X2 [Penaeus japonicus]